MPLCVLADARAAFDAVGEYRVHRENKQGDERDEGKSCRGVSLGENRCPKYNACDDKQAPDAEGAA